MGVVGVGGSGGEKGYLDRYHRGAPLRHGKRGLVGAERDVAGAAEEKVDSVIRVSTRHSATCPDENLTRELERRRLVHGRRLVERGKWAAVRGDGGTGLDDALYEFPHNGAGVWTDGERGHGGARGGQDVTLMMYSPYHFLC